VLQYTRVTYILCLMVQDREPEIESQLGFCGTLVCSHIQRDRIARRNYVVRATPCNPYVDQSSRRLRSRFLTMWSLLLSCSP
jgi:hypothetical protein